MLANILQRCANSEAKSLIANDKYMAFIFWHGCCGNVGHAVYEKARTLNPARWSGKTRDWTPIGAVTLNPERDFVIRAHSGDNPIQQLAV